LSAKTRSHGASRASLSQQGKLQQARELCCTASRKFRHGHLKEKKGLLEKAVPHTIEHPQEVYRCNYFNQRQEWPSGSQIEMVPFSRLRAA
jgi:hypothetical protein